MTDSNRNCDNPKVTKKLMTKLSIGHLLQCNKTKLSSLIDKHNLVSHLTKDLIGPLFKQTNNLKKIARKWCISPFPLGGMMQFTILVLSP